MPFLKQELSSLGQDQAPRKRTLNVFSQENAASPDPGRAVPQSRAAERRGERKFKTARSSYRSSEKTPRELNFTEQYIRTHRKRKRNQ